ncbi:pilus assembly protein [Myxococcaceae bacterium GXIMD 01537]
MKSTVNHSIERAGQGRRGARSARRRSRGGAMVEFAIMVPILLGLIFWANYFWEVSFARIKAAEVSRFVAFERTVRSNIPSIVAEARDRYQDLDGSTKGVTKPKGITNGVTLTVTAQDAPAPIAGSISETNSQNGNPAGGFLSDIASMMGDAVETIIGLIGFDTNKGAVRVDVQIQIKNNIIPKKIVDYVSGFNDNRLDLKLKDNFYVYHDTWRAWREGANPRQTYPIVQQITQDRVKKIAYIGLADKAGGVLSGIEKFLDVLGLEFPLGPDYIKDSTLINKVKDNGRYATMGGRATRTVPGDVLQAYYWRTDTQACFNSCEPADIKRKRGLISSSGDKANWPMRAYNCRGDFFQGAKKSKDPEIVYSKNSDKSYFNYGSNACE